MLPLRHFAVPVCSSQDKKHSLSTACAAQATCSGAPAPNPSAPQSTAQHGWRSSTLLSSSRWCMNADLSYSCTSEGLPNISLIISVTTVLTQSLRDFGHAKASACTITEGNSAMRFLNHFHPLFPLSINTLNSVLQGWVPTLFALLPTLRSLATTALKGEAGDIHTPCNTTAEMQVLQSCQCL